jgi:hypothetical protein
MTNRCFASLPPTILARSEPNRGVIQCLYALNAAPFVQYLFSRTGKAYLQRNGTVVREAEDPIAVLYESCGRITAQMAEGWFWHAGHYVDVEN